MARSDPTAYVILEGVSASRDAFRPFLSSRFGSRLHETSDCGVGLNETVRRHANNGTHGWRRKMSISSASVRRRRLI
jgi:hypothetical protein